MVVVVAIICLTGVIVVVCYTTHPDVCLAERGAGMCRGYSTVSPPGPVVLFQPRGAKTLGSRAWEMGDDTWDVPMRQAAGSPGAFGPDAIVAGARLVWFGMQYVCKIARWLVYYRRFLLAFSQELKIEVPGLPGWGRVGGGWLHLPEKKENEMSELTVRHAVRPVPCRIPFPSSGRLWFYTIVKNTRDFYHKR